LKNIFFFLLFFNKNGSLIVEIQKLFPTFVSNTVHPIFLINTKNKLLVDFHRENVPPPSLLSNGSVITQKNNSKIFFPWGPLPF